MKKKEAKFMRLFVMFDLPTNTKKDRKYATKFRNYLIKLGFMMLQYSIYMRVCKGDDNANKYSKKVKTNLPPKGNVRLLQITEKQYERMEILVGKENFQEKNISYRQLSLF